MTPTELTKPRIALRPYTAEGGQAHGRTGPDEPLDDVYVERVTMFRLEDLGDWVWMCCYLDDEGSRISFHLRPGESDDEPLIVVTAVDCPSFVAGGEVVTYEGEPALVDPPPLREPLSPALVNLPALTGVELRVLADRLGPYDGMDDRVANALRTAVAEAIYAADLLDS